MSNEGTGDRLSPGEEPRERVLEEARAVSEKALERLRGLASQLPEGAVEHVERLHRDPAAERRRAARLADSPLPVAVRLGALHDETGAVRDHCPTGMAVLLPCPAGVGTVLRVRMPDGLGGGGWVSVEVRHCRKVEGGWVAGCELVGNQPPI